MKLKITAITTTIRPKKIKIGRNLRGPGRVTKQVNEENVIFVRLTAEGDQDVSEI